MRKVQMTKSCFFDFSQWQKWVGFGFNSLQILNCYRISFLYTANVTIIWHTEILKHASLIQYTWEMPTLPKHITASLPLRIGQVSQIRQPDRLKVPPFFWKSNDPSWGFMTWHSCHPDGFGEDFLATKDDDNHGYWRKRVFLFGVFYMGNLENKLVAWIIFQEENYYGYT